MKLRLTAFQKRWRIEMSEMIDRLTEVIFDGGDSTKSASREIAIAVLKALREPTAGMLSAMEPWSRVSGHHELVWKSGIDEALK